MKFLLVSAAAAAMDRQTYILGTQIPCWLMTGEMLPLSVLTKAEFGPWAAALKHHGCVWQPRWPGLLSAWCCPRIAFAGDHPLHCWAVPWARPSSCTPPHSSQGQGGRSKTGVCFAPVAPAAQLYPLSDGPRAVRHCSSSSFPTLGGEPHVFLLDSHLPDPWGFSPAGKKRRIIRNAGTIVCYNSRDTLQLQV